MFEKLIYLDNNATTKVDDKVLEAMLPYFTTLYGNAASYEHSFGRYSKKGIENARSQVAELIGAHPNEIFFTSGATESINLAIKGIALANKKKGNHIITVNTEHTAILDTCKYLTRNGFSVSLLNVNQQGEIDLEELKNLIRDDTIIVTAMHANNETGVIHPLEEISKIVKQTRNIYFITDATAAVGKVHINVKKIAIDALILSGHKIYGPKGVGALYLNRSNHYMEAVPQIHGGGHEHGYRSGTLNVPGIIGLGKACEILISQMDEEQSRIGNLRNLLENKLNVLDGVSINGLGNRLNNVANICFTNVDNQTLMLSLPNVAASSGSACTSSLKNKSHVLKAMGLTDVQISSSIRFSLGRFNTKLEIDYVGDTLLFNIKRLREKFKYSIQ